MVERMICCLPFHCRHVQSYLMVPRRGNHCCHRLLDKSCLRLCWLAKVSAEGGYSHEARRIIKLAALKMKVYTLFEGK